MFDRNRVEKSISLCWSSLKIRAAIIWTDDTWSINKEASLLVYNKARSLATNEVIIFFKGYQLWLPIFNRSPATTGQLQVNWSVFDALHQSGINGWPVPSNGYLSLWSRHLPRALQSVTRNLGPPHGRKNMFPCCLSAEMSGSLASLETP